MKKFMKKLAKKSEGFTLVELIVVIAILGILAGVAVPAYSGYLTKAKEASDIVQLDAVKTAAQAALAKKGSIVKLTVSADGKEVTAYTDMGNPSASPAVAATDYVLNSATAANEDPEHADYDLFITDTFTLESETYKSGKPAGWNKD